MRDDDALSRRSALWLYLAAGTLIVVPIAVTVAWVGPLPPPRVVVMSTRTAGSTYEVFAERRTGALKSERLAPRRRPSRWRFRVTQLVALQERDPPLT